MKKLTSLLAGLALVGSIAAAPKKPAPKPAVAPAAVAAPTAAPMAPPPAKSDAGGTISIGAYGSLNFASSDSFTAAGTGVTDTKGGYGFGGNLIFGNRVVRGGLNVAYMPVRIQESSIAKRSAIYLPIEGTLRIYPIAGLYIAGFLGYALDIGTTTETGVSFSKLNGYSVGGGAGYLFEFGVVGIDIGADFRMFLLAPSSGTGTTTMTNITPRVGINFRF